MHGNIYINGTTTNFELITPLTFIILIAYDHKHITLRFIILIVLMIQTNRTLFALAFAGSQPVLHLVFVIVGVLRLISMLNDRWG